MHEIEAKVLLSAKNGMNVYRGCEHGCIYCDSRSKCYNMDHDFEDVAVKTNAPQLLEEALLKKNDKCMIGFGSMSDPYTPIEKELKYTQKCLEIISKHGFGVALQTKSDLVLRDLELFKKINYNAKCVIQMTLTTADDELCRIVEPNVCVTSKRVEALKTLNENGIPTVVWLTPFLPYINDNEENLKKLLEYCKECNVKGIIYFGCGLTLREGNREYYYKMLDKHYPLMKKRYMFEFGNNYEVYRPGKQQTFKMIIEAFCKENDIMYKPDDVFYYLNNIEPKKEQLSLFDL